jgi:hypothetical protein
MRYVEPFTYLFHQRHLGMTLLVGSVLFLVPVVGPIVVMGWCVLLHRALAEGRREVPPLGFEDFSRLLDLGLGPFLVSLLVSLGMFVVLLPLLAVPAVVVGVAMPRLASAGEGEAVLLVVLLVAALAALVLLVVGYLVAMVHKAALIRAELTPEMGAAIASLRWSAIRGFLRVCPRELFFASVAHGLGSSLLTFVGLALGSIGVYPAVVVSQAAGAHFRAQIYRVYLERGGEPLPVSPLRWEPARPVGGPFA